MTVLDFDFSQRQVQMTCGECGINFTMPQEFHRERAEHGKTWYCPNGHPRVYRQSEVEKLKKELAEKERQLEFERQRATKNYTERVKAETKLKKISRRTSGGVCPCCNRSFATLQRHMKTKHPDFIAESK